MNKNCVVCGNRIDGADRQVLVYGNVREAHCSESCLRDNLHKRRLASTRARRRWFLAALSIALLLGAANTLWHRFRAPQPEWIATPPLEPVIVQEEAPLGPTYFGPAWPPTDAEWIALFEKASWTFPLPGPNRRAIRIDHHIFGPEGGPKDWAPRCRKEGACGVDLGGELWGEHVLAAQDGIVDRVHATGDDEHGGQYVRLSHFGGMVYTQYFHLAAMPRNIVRGARIKAGDLLGALGDTGVTFKGGRRHLHFALSVRPSSALQEVYWDPTPWIAEGHLRLPLHGTVAGLVPVQQKEAAPSRRRRTRTP